MFDKTVCKDNLLLLIANIVESCASRKQRKIENEPSGVVFGHQPYFTLSDIFFSFWTDLVVIHRRYACSQPNSKSGRQKYALSCSIILKSTDNQCPLRAFVVVINREIGRFVHMSNVRESNKTMEEILFNITGDSGDSNRKERLVNRYGFPLARTNSNFCIPEKKWHQYLTCAQRTLVAGGPSKIVLAVFAKKKTCMCAYVKTAPHYRLAIKCSETQKKMPTWSSFKHVRTKSTFSGSFVYVLPCFNLQGC